MIMYVQNKRRKLRCRIYIGSVVSSSVTIIVCFCDVIFVIFIFIFVSVTVPLELLPINVTSPEVESQLTYENCYLEDTGHFRHDLTIDLSRMPQEGFSIIIGEQ